MLPHRPSHRLQLLPSLLTNLTTALVHVPRAATVFGEAAGARRERQGVHAVRPRHITEVRNYPGRFCCFGARVNASALENVGVCGHVHSRMKAVVSCAAVPHFLAAAGR